MGIAAVSSHAVSKKHPTAVSIVRSASQTNIRAFFGAGPNLPCSMTATTTSECVSTVPSTSAESVPAKPVAVAPDGKASLNGFLVKKCVTKAEVVWCLNTIVTHGSFRSAAASAALFPIMFPTCDVAKKLQLGKDKVGYTICYGIAPYFRNRLLSKLHSVPHVVVAFDESLNKIAQKEQMDVLIRFWDPADDVVKTRYLTSCFLGHTRAEDLAAAFKKATENIEPAKILQLSMDGPNVNLKLLKSLKQEFSASDGNQNIVDIGSCGLHVVSGAFKTGHNVTKWNTVVFLRSLYNLFKNVPARRADYVNFTGSILFPLKFCSVRWLENGKALARALQVLPNVVKYVEHVKKEKKLQACGSYAHVETAVKDEMLPVKLAFMLSVSEELEPFLAEFQTEKLMLPFLATALDGLLRSLLGRIVLKEKLDAAGTFSKLIKIDLENPNNIIGIAAFDIGLAAKSELRKITKPSHTAVVSVKKECILFIKACLAKIIERSPLKYKLTRGASCLNPAVCAASVEAGQKQLNIALEVLIEHGRLTGLQGERASRSYVQVCSNSTAQVRLRKFDRARERLEKLWVELCASSHEELLLFVKIVLCLSHGNSSVERGFSVNKECLVENMKEESLVAQRLVYDEVSAAGGVAEVDVTDKMIDMVRSSNIKWKEDLERKKKERLDVLDAERKKKRTAALVKELESKKQKLMEDAQLQVSMLQQEIESLKQ
ncbi:hypothetical protein HPB51_024557 [Rhipicephalus microplus]|uniref:Uncharacterized protein n=1 Tax=Rhipicephalus microplus TaxID=6941 RepID=A0A9J6DK12_RHIMP|nr:hypothetical protein HPB51_024557 [Rhipicephalus microplus]